METFEDGAFRVEATSEPGCRLSLRVFVKPEESKKCYKKGIKKVNKQISVPGFRKGKAPESSVISRHPNHIESEWKELLVHAALNAGFQLSKQYPLSKESLDQPKLESYSMEEGAVVTFSFEHYPEVPSIDFGSISLPSVEREEVTPEKVQEVVLQIQKSHADFEEIEDRAIEDGDYVDLTIDAIDRDPVMNIVKERRFPVEKEVMGEWMRTLLIGKKSGESVEGMSENEKNEPDFKPTQVKIEIHKIHKILLPEADDALAKRVGLGSMEELKTKIRENLEKESEQKQKEQQIRVLDEALIEAYSFDLPSSIVEGERRHRIKEKIRLLQHQELDAETIKNREAEIEKEVAGSVEGALRLYFINKQIERQGKITLSREELNRELAEQIATNPAYRQKDMDKESSKALIERISSSLMERKTKEYALSQVLQS